MTPVYLVHYHEAPVPYKVLVAPVVPFFKPFFSLETLPEIPLVPFTRGKLGMNLFWAQKGRLVEMILVLNLAGEYESLATPGNIRKL